jgi:antitoxin YefM
MIETSYSRARAQLAKLLDEVVENRETVVIRRWKGEAVAMIAASELSSLVETAHLLRSPRNAERLLAALVRARSREGKPMTVKQLRAALGLAPGRQGRVSSRMGYERGAQILINQLERLLDRLSTSDHRQRATMDGEQADQDAPLAAQAASTSATAQTRPSRGKMRCTANQWASASSAAMASSTRISW